jgi:hypothetical protein
MDFYVCKASNLGNTVVEGKKDNASPKAIPVAPDTQKFKLESSGEKLVFWVDNPIYQGNLPWKITIKPTAPADVNVTIGGN